MFGFYDLQLYGNDIAFLRDKLMGMRMIFNYFNKYQKSRRYH